MKEHEGITSKEYANLFDVTDRTVRNDLKELIGKNIVERKGISDKTTYYVLAENISIPRKECKKPMYPRSC